MPKVRTDYSKFSKDRGHVERTEKRQREQGFFEMYDRQPVIVKLTNGEEMHGHLRANTYNRYDFILECEEAAFLIRKDCLLYLSKKHSTDAQLGNE
jgi:sRNA-binding regulator protein Hfq